jgi:DNA-binding LytR/AlgR family response regulator
MKLLFKICFLIVACYFTMENSMAVRLVSIDRQAVTICPAANNTSQPPTFDDEQCKQVSAYEIDPQNTAIWIKAKLNIPQDMLNDKQPQSIYIFGKTSSRLYFNGHYIGQNGTPSTNSLEEFVGNMDTRFYIPPELLLKQHNELTIHMSSHHGFLDLKTPIHLIAFGNYVEPTIIIQRNIWISLLLLGVLVLGCFYFVVLSINQHKRKANVLFAIMAFVAAVQLFVEISRGLFSYPYPVHDIRLLLIVSLSTLFGVLLLFYIFTKIQLKNKLIWLLVSFILTVISVIFLEGFDGKTALAILIPIKISTVFLGIHALKQKSKQLWGYFAVFAAFTIITAVSLYSFHDVLFYYMITGMLCFIFVQKARELSGEQKRRQSEEKQVEKLQFKLEQNAQQKTPPKIKITSASKIELVSTHLITFCKAAGDYVEINLQDKKQLLFSGNLKDLESQLPITFLRVHRSYIVNTDFITSLKNTAGSGKLLLQNGVDVPVSRRIMPMVRTVITGT